MPSQIGTSIRRALRPAPKASREPVHFHVASDGRAFVCDFATCDSPTVGLGDIQPQSINQSR